MVWDYYVLNPDDAVPELTEGTEIKLYRDSNGPIPEGRWSLTDVRGEVVAGQSASFDGADYTWVWEGCEIRIPQPPAYSFASRVYLDSVRGAVVTKGFDITLVVAILHVLSAVIPLVRECWPNKTVSSAVYTAVHSRWPFSAMYKRRLRKLVSEYAPKEYARDVTETLWAKSTGMTVPAIRSVLDE